MLKLPKIFGEGCVLQRDMPVCIWGNAEPNEKICIGIRKGEQLLASCECLADEKGDFQGELSRIPAGGIYQLWVEGKKEKLCISEVWAGDVFICAGQSNMELPMNRVAWKYPEEFEEGNPDVHIYKVIEQYEFERPLTDHKTADWKSCIPQNLGVISAFSYFMGKEISKTKKIPVGILNLSLGGTPVEAWMSRECLADHVQYLQQLEKVQNPACAAKFREEGESAQELWYRELEKQESLSEEAEEIWHSIFLPTVLADAGLKDFCGSLWLKRKFSVPDEAAGKEALLEFGTLIDSDQMYINGVKIGETGYRYPPRRYPVPAGLIKKGENEIVIHLVCRDGDGRITPGKNHRIMWKNIEEYSVSLEGTWEYRIHAKCDPAPEQVFLNRTPAGLFQGMVSPCLPYAVRGAVWYQGESNDSHPDDYAELLRDMIADWRRQWNQKNLPFVVVQLPNCGVDIAGGDAWPKIRYAQSEAEKVENTAVTVNLDLGEDNDLHPLAKKEIAHRAVLAIRHLVYKEKLAWTAPKPFLSEKNREGMQILFRDRFSKKTEEVLLGRRDAVSQLIRNAEDSADAPGLFELCGADGIWKPAAAVKTETGILVRSSAVSEPEAVRYAWKAAPGSLLLYSKDGFPVGPFVLS